MISLHIAVRRTLNRSIASVISLRIVVRRTLNRTMASMFRVLLTSFIIPTGLFMLLAIVPPRRVYNRSKSGVLASPAAIPRRGLSRRPMLGLAPVGSQLDTGLVAEVMFLP